MILDLAGIRYLMYSDPDPAPNPAPDPTTDPAPDPAIFAIDLKECLLLFEDTFTSFFKDKKIIKKSQNSRIQGFSYHFCLVIEGSGSSY